MTQGLTISGYGLTLVSSFHSIGEINLRPIFLPQAQNALINQVEVRFWGSEQILDLPLDLPLDPLLSARSAPGPQVCVRGADTTNEHGCLRAVRRCQKSPEMSRTGPKGARAPVREQGASLCSGGS